MVAPNLALRSSAPPRARVPTPESKRSRRILLLEGPVGAIAAGIHANFVGPFALRLSATTFQMGMLTAFTELLTALTQLFASRIVGLLGGRKRMVVTTILLSALPWLFMALVPFAPASMRVWMLIPLSAAAISLFMISDPAVGSWISDVVPKDRRGSFLGLRGSAATLSLVTIALSGAMVLDRLGGAVLWGFVVVFLMALMARMVSAYMFSRVADPRPDVRIKPGMAPWQYIAHMGQTTLGRYNLFIFVFHFAMGCGGPFFGVYLLRDLGFSYLVFVSLGVISNVAAIFTMPLWGRLADRRGNMFVLAIAAPSLAIFPLTWVVSPQPWYLLLTHIFGGIIGAGWGIGAYNFVLEGSDEETRTSAVGYFRAMASLGVFAGSLMGGAIAAFLPTILPYQLMTLFLLSATLRIITVAVFLPRVRGHAPRVVSASHSSS